MMGQSTGKLGFSSCNFKHNTKWRMLTSGDVEENDFIFGIVTHNKSHLLLRRAFHLIVIFHPEISRKGENGHFRHDC